MQNPNLRDSHASPSHYDAGIFPEAGVTLNSVFKNTILSNGFSALNSLKNTGQLPAQYQLPAQSQSVGMNNDERIELFMDVKKNL